MLTLSKGTTIHDGRYVIQGVIGTGGYASVFRASDTQLNRDVAIKRLLKDGRSALTDNVEAMREEAQKHAQLIHANIVQVYDVFEEKGELLMVMEFVDGKALLDAFRENSRRAIAFPLDQGMQILGDILSGVAYAHSKNVCHRDLGPHNILLTTGGTPKIADFGIARVLTPGSGLQGTSQAGTGHREFMSPEQARGEPADFLSDLFTVGIVGYLLLTGRHPFADPSGMFQIEERLRDADFNPETPRPPASLSAAQQRLFREFAAIVMRLLSREKAGRFATTIEAIDAIEALTPSALCPACDERIPEESVFCLYCGVPVSHAAASTHAADLSDASAHDLVEDGYRLSTLHKWDAAILQYHAAIALDPFYHKAYRNLGHALNHIREYERAAKILTSGLALHPTSPEHRAALLYERSVARFSLKQYSDAYDDIQDALAHRPNHPRFLYLRAQIQAGQGNDVEARLDAQQVLRRIPDHAGARRLLGDLADAR